MTSSTERTLASRAYPAVIGDGKVQPAELRRLEKVLGDCFRIVKHLGTGGMGSVYEAVDLASQQPVAIKLLRQAQEVNKQLVRRFMREAQVMATLDNPHLVKVKDIGQALDGTPFIVMGLLRGRNLREVLKDGALDAERAASLLSAALRGVAHAHALGVVHRDLKPENLFLEQANNTSKGESLRVLDFGIAKVLGVAGSTTGSSSPGTVRYMAPEQIRGKECGVQVDIYALGAVLYECLAGAPVFATEDRNSLMFHIVHETPPLLSERCPELPASLVQAAHVALAKEPRDRFSTAMEFADALDAVFHHNTPRHSDSDTTDLRLAHAVQAGGTGTRVAGPDALSDPPKRTQAAPVASRTESPSKKVVRGPLPSFLHLTLWGLGAFALGALVVSLRAEGPSVAADLSKVEHEPEERLPSMPAQPSTRPREGMVPATSGSLQTRGTEDSPTESRSPLGPVRVVQRTSKRTVSSPPRLEEPPPPLPEASTHPKKAPVSTSRVTEVAAPEPPPTEPLRAGPSRTEPPRTEPPRTEPPRTEPPRTEPRSFEAPVRFSGDNPYAE